MKLSSPNDLSFSPISPFKVLDEIHGLDSTKAAGHEGIPIRRIISVAESIYQPLCHIFNTSLLTCTFPDKMKIAKVIPLYKGDGDSSSVSNYRPISLLPTLSKIFERIMCESLTNHLEQNNLLFDFQFGFRKKA